LLRTTPFSYNNGSPLQADAFRGRSVSLLVANDLCKSDFAQVADCGVSRGHAFSAGVADFHYSQLIKVNRHIQPVFKISSLLYLRRVIAGAGMKRSNRRYNVFDY
ncbi:hypothetical protein, partial [Paenisporosarcina sp.]|uniref:hypothetical protein n=1 Tax=Paenisporosarcina sp. TaxID=1932001 RepID=UPI003C707A12